VSGLLLGGILVRVAWAVLAAATANTPAPAPPHAPVKPCTVLAPDAKPIIEVAGKGRRPPLAFYALGFSKTGRLAWLELRQGFDSEDYNWILYVVDLNSDRPLVEREFPLKSSSVQALCARHDTAIARVLDKLDVERGRALALEQPEATLAPPTVELARGRRDREASKTPYRVLLRGRDGVKQLGTLWRVEVDSGQAPLGVPKLAGILRSPFEPRVAVLVTQQMIGDEGAELTMVKVLGARLDRGWRKAE
jgi:hypothetical protein